MNLRFELTGLTPMLQHNDNIEAADALMAWRKDTRNKNVSTAGDDRSPAWTWQTYLYHDGANISLPSQNLMVALRAAGAQIILKKQKTFKELSQSGMGILSEYCDFRVAGKTVPIDAVHAVQEMPFAEQADAVRALGFRLYLKRAVIGKAKHVRVRPRFDVWSASGEIVVSAPELTHDVVSKLFDLAGRVGLCDWRPGCKTPGPFGMFSAKVLK